MSGESNNINIHYTINDMKRSLLMSCDDDSSDISTTSFLHSSLSNPVLVVGDGLSAADAVIYCLLKNIPVIHCFKRSPKEIRRKFFSCYCIEPEGESYRTTT